MYRPHKCPDPKAKNSAPTNFAMRVARRSIALTGNDRARLDRKLVYSRFCPVRTFRLSEDDGFFTCCEFLVSIIGYFWQIHPKYIDEIRREGEELSKVNVGVMSGG